MSARERIIYLMERMGTEATELDAELVSEVLDGMGIADADIRKLDEDEWLGMLDAAGILSGTRCTTFARGKQIALEVRDEFTSAQAAAILGITPDRVRKMAQSGRVSARKFGRDWMFTAEALRAVAVRRPGRPVSG